MPQDILTKHCADLAASSSSPSSFSPGGVFKCLMHEETIKANVNQLEIQVWVTVCLCVCA